jgi:hypothetical protein
MAGLMRDFRPTLLAVMLAAAFENNGCFIVSFLA